MKTKLLTSIAAAALIAGSGAVFAQGSGQEKSPGMSQGGSGGMSQGGASQSAPAEKMSPGTTGQGSQSAPKAGQSSDDMKSKSGSTAKDDDKSKSRTTGQGAKDKAGSTAKDDDKSKSKAGAASKNDDKTRAGTSAQGEKDKAGSTAQGEKSKAGSTTGQGAAGASASLTTEQKTKISTTIKQTNVRPVENVNFNISVGTVVPRNVELHTLPTTVVEVYPAWRGYRYILVQEEIVIIDPATYRIVAVINV
jgi:hypothetical protein